MIPRIAIPYVQSGEEDTALSKLTHVKSLSAQLLVCVLLSFIVAVLSFMALYALGNELVDHTFYSERFADKMSDRQFARLQKFVTQEKITSMKVNRLNVWSLNGGDAFLSLYLEDALIFQSPVAKDPALDLENLDTEDVKVGRKYNLVFYDGVAAQAFLYYYASNSFYFWMIGVSGVLSFVVFSMFFVSFVNRKVHYIKKLKKELDILSGGNLELPVTVKGSDEIGELASGIDEMRRSILSHQRSEDEIRSANSQLVTAMSHDLRTPLTSLMAFLEILDRGKVVDEDQRRHLIQQSLAKAMSIKSIADKLFEYFLVYTSEWEKPSMQMQDADELFLQFWQEYAFALESHGFTVHTSFPELKGRIEVNIDLLRRAFDNLYSNLVKYADPLQPIIISYQRQDGQFNLLLSNAVSGRRDRKESTNIGLNTCSRILHMHNGSFEKTEENNIFTVSINLPLVP